MKATYLDIHSFYSDAKMLWKLTPTLQYCCHSGVCSHQEPRATLTHEFVRLRHCALIIRALFLTDLYFLLFTIDNGDLS